jgi:hypothetical protein
MTFSPDAEAARLADDAYRRYQRLVAQLAPVSASPW